MSDYDSWLNNESDYLDSVGDDRSDLVESRRNYGRLKEEGPGEDLYEENKIKREEDGRKR